MTQLEDRYLRRHGEVLTFGSGDCGQLAHGIDDDDDLTVRFPRVVYSLRDKKVCGIACGGLHNAVFTEEGHVYTWGCGDDGSLGRYRFFHASYNPMNFNNLDRLFMTFYVKAWRREYATVSGSTTTRYRQRIGLR